MKLKGTGKNTKAIGAVVTVRSGELVQRRLVQSGTSYISQDDKRQHCGLGQATEVDSIRGVVPDGTRSKMENLKANQLVAIEQAPDASPCQPRLASARRSQARRR